MTFAILTIREVEMRSSPTSQQRLASTCHGRAKERRKGVARHEQKHFSLVAMAYGDDQGVVAWRSMNDKREALIGTRMIKSGARIYPK